MTSEIEKATVISLLRSLPDDSLISIGVIDDFTLTKDELIDRVNKDDEVGKKIVNIYMNYLRSLKELSK